MISFYSKYCYSAIAREEHAEKNLVVSANLKVYKRSKLTLLGQVPFDQSTVLNNTYPNSYHTIELLSLFRLFMSEI